MVRLADAVHISRRTWPCCEVTCAGPVRFVVPRSAARYAEVRNLVMLKDGAGKTIDSKRVHVALERFINLHELTSSSSGPKCGPELEREAVGRYMFGCECNRAFEIV